MNENVYELTNLNTACDEFVSGKYILADIKIASILKLIDADEKVKNLVASTLNKFDFVEFFKASIIDNDDETYTLVMPTDEKEIIAFVYSLLYRFNTKEIDFYNFLTKFYRADDAVGQEFKLFAESVILPFKNALNSLYSKRHIIVNSNDYADFVIQLTGMSRNYIENDPNISYCKFLDNNYAVIYVNRRILPEYNSSPLNAYIKEPFLLGLMDTSALEAAGILDIQTQPYLNLTGQNILVAIIDTGIDYTNEAFIYEDGTSKIYSIWDQTASGNPPDSICYIFGAHPNSSLV